MPAGPPKDGEGLRPSLLTSLIREQVWSEIAIKARQNGKLVFKCHLAQNKSLMHALLHAFVCTCLSGLAFLVMSSA